MQGCNPLANLWVREPKTPRRWQAAVLFFNIAHLKVTHVIKII